jgi:hypothetical protein
VSSTHAYHQVRRHEGDAKPELTGLRHGRSRALTADEKYEVASTEIEVLQSANEKIRTEGDKTLDELRVCAAPTRTHLAC